MIEVFVSDSVFKIRDAVDVIYAASLSDTGKLL